MKADLAIFTEVSKPEPKQSTVEPNTQDDSSDEIYSDLDLLLADLDVDQR
jgi:hypothetical protein